MLEGFLSSLLPEDQHRVVLELQPQALSRDRTAARDLETCFSGLYYLIKEAINFLAREQGFALLYYFSLPNHFTNVKQRILTTHFQGAVGMFYLNVTVVFNQANRKLVSHEISIFWPSG